MKTTYSNFYSIIDQQSGAPFSPDSKGVPFVVYSIPEGPTDFNLLKAVISEVRHNCKTLGFALEGSEDSPFIQV
jgi:hypothetical protein